ncbi:MAG: hypothetical protein M1312_01125 [Patescibacteria group bacterium]|nr:hypothetical protein [Patescibacteria group bacterium]
MKIGLDFDGVVADSSDNQEIKSRWAEKLYGVKVPPCDFKKGYVVGNGILTAEQYANLQNFIYGNREIGMAMRPVSGALEFIPRLVANGHLVSVITSRERPALEIAVEWTAKNGLRIPFVGVGYGISKANAAAGMNVFVDDDVNKLKNLLGVVRYRFLFSWLYNAEVDVHNVARVHSWEELYSAIQALGGDR